MSCEQHVEALGEYVDGTLAPEAGRRLEEHLASCAACRQLATDLGRIREAAAKLPARTPPDRVWARIVNELAAPQAALPATKPPRTWLPGTLLGGWFGRLASPVPLLATIVLLLAVTGAYFALNRGSAGRLATLPPATVAGRPATAEHAADADLVKTVQEELQLAEQHYDKAVTGLEQIMKAGQGTLDPQVATTLQKNMALIDQAISDSRQALRSQPTSQLAQESLFEAFRRKVALLQDTVALINEMRKGNEAGAAKIIGNLNKS